MPELPVEHSIDELDIIENFTNADGDVLLRLARQVGHSGAIFVEVGSWKGHSTIFLGKVAQECQGNVYCVDHWKGTPGVAIHDNAIDCFSIFRHNMETLGLDKVVHPLVMDSMMAGSIFASELADLVFIDANHLYNYFIDDLRVWYEKVKVGGIICGHDSDIYYSSYPNHEILDCLLDWDSVGRIVIKGKKFDIQPNGNGIHCGIAKGLYEKFNDKYERSGVSMWFKVKE